ILGTKVFVDDDDGKTEFHPATPEDRVVPYARKESGVSGRWPHPSSGPHCAPLWARDASDLAAEQEIASAAGTAASDVGGDQDSGPGDQPEAKRRSQPLSPALVLLGGH